MIIRALVNQYAYLGNNFKVECPVGSGRQLNLLEVSQEIARRLSRLFIRNTEERRPGHGFLAGKKGDTVIDLTKLGAATDKFIDNCLDNPKSMALDVMTAAVQ